MRFLLYAAGDESEMGEQVVSGMAEDLPNGSMPHPSRFRGNYQPCISLLPYYAIIDIYVSGKSVRFPD
jgi:hypothetical protein